MSAVKAAMARAIPLRRRDREALDQVRADWRHEAALASSAAGRLAVDLRGMLAMVTALARVGGADVRRALGHPVFAAAGAWLLLFGAATWLDLTWRPPSLASAVPADAWALIVRGAVTERTAQLIPLAFFLAACMTHAPTRGHVPLLGLGVSGFALVLLVQGGFVPLSGGPHAIVTGGQFHGLTSEPTVLSLFVHQDPARALSAVQQASHVFGQAAAAFALVLLAHPIPSRGPRRWALLALMVGACLLIGFAPDYGDNSLLRLSSWKIAAAGAACAAALALRRPAPAREA